MITFEYRRFAATSDISKNMEVLKGINLSLRFILELILLIIFVYSSYHIFKNTFVRWFIAIGLPVAVASLWGYYIAPKSQHILSMPWRNIVIIMLFLLAALLLAKANQHRLAIIFIGIFAINEILMVLWGQY